MSDQISGVDIVAAVYDETAYGVAPGTPDGKAVCFSEISINPNEELLTDPSLCTGSGRGVQKPGRAGLDPNGSFSLIPAPEHIGWWLRHLLGEPATTGTGPYTHTFNIDALPVGFEFEFDFTSKVANKVVRFPGGRIKDMTFTVPNRGFVTASGNLLFSDHVIDTAPLDATITAISGHTGFTVAHASIEIDDTEICEVRSLSFTVNNSLEEDNFTICSGGKRGGAGEGECIVTGTMEVVFSVDRWDLVQAAYDDTAIKLEVLLVNGTDELNFTMNQVSVARNHPAQNTKKGLILNVPFSAYAGTAPDLGLVAVLINDQATVHH